MVIAARTGAVISDALVLATTWLQTFKLRRVAKSVRVQTPLVSLLLKDGEYVSDIWFNCLYTQYINHRHTILLVRAVFICLYEWRYFLNIGKKRSPLLVLNMLDIILSLQLPELSSVCPNLFLCGRLLESVIALEGCPGRRRDRLLYNPAFVDADVKIYSQSLSTFGQQHRSRFKCSQCNRFPDHVHTFSQFTICGENCGAHRCYA